MVIRLSGLYWYPGSPEDRKGSAIATAAVSDLMDAKDDAVRTDLPTDIANALLTIERRIAALTYWIPSVVVATVGIAAGVVIAVLK